MSEPAAHQAIVRRRDAEQALPGDCPEIHHRRCADPDEKSAYQVVHNRSLLFAFTCLPLGGTGCTVPLQVNLKSRGCGIWTIAEVAKRSGIPASTLRFYEELGLIASVGRRGLRRVFDPGVLEGCAHRTGALSRLFAR